MEAKTALLQLLLLLLWIRKVALKSKALHWTRRDVRIRYTDVKQKVEPAHKDELGRKADNMAQWVYYFSSLQPVVCCCFEKMLKTVR